MKQSKKKTKRERKKTTRKKKEKKKENNEKKKEERWERRKTREYIQGKKSWINKLHNSIWHLHDHVCVKTQLCVYAQRGYRMY